MGAGTAVSLSLVPRRYATENIFLPLHTFWTKENKSQASHGPSLLFSFHLNFLLSFPLLWSFFYSLNMIIYPQAFYLNSFIPLSPWFHCKCFHPQVAGITVWHKQRDLFFSPEDKFINKYLLALIQQLINVRALRRLASWVYWPVPHGHKIVAAAPNYAAAFRGIKHFSTWGRQILFICLPLNM